MQRAIYRNVILPTFDRLKRRSTFAYWSDLDKSQWLSREELESRQILALTKLLVHAQAHCPYYRDAWSRAGLFAKDLQSLDDFRNWPLIGRETINANREQMKATDRNWKLIAKSTGGSSGEPLHFFLDNVSNDRRTAAAHRGYSWAGAEPGTKQVYLWGAAIGRQSARHRWKEYLYQRWLHRRHMISTFDLSEANVPRFFAELNHYRPEAIVAYTNPLYVFARSLEERGLRPHAPNSIVVGAEKLHAFQREVIERVFRAPVFETYGSREFMLIGAECEQHCGLHLTMEHLIVEIVDDEGHPVPSGQEGNIVVTDLFNYGMPFVRYVTGDRGVAGFDSCGCGRGLPLLREVVGRQLDVLTTPDGRTVAGEFFPHLMKDFRSIRRFQVVQDCPEEIAISLVIDAHWTESQRRQLTDTVRETVGPLASVIVHEVDDIPLTHAGKFKVVVNNCAPRTSVGEACRG